MNELPVPIIIPPKSEVVADKIWISRLIIEAPAVDAPTTIRAKIAPFNSTSGIISKEETKDLYIEDLFTLAGQDPEIGTALYYFVNAINKICINQNLFWTPPPE